MGFRCRYVISIHPPRAGRDVFRPVLGVVIEISIHPPRAGRDQVLRFPHAAQFISIHPPRAGRDCDHRHRGCRRGISIHPPRAGRDRRGDRSYRTTCGFQSTRPVRGGTGSWWTVRRSLRHFNPPAPCGAGPTVEITDRPKGNFNPPAPCGAGLVVQPDKSKRIGFQSTRPVRGGTGHRGDAQHRAQISIHPPRAGRDEQNCVKKVSTPVFQSTRPVRGGTLDQLILVHQCAISIHPPRAGRDGRSEYRGDIRVPISIHPPRAGRDVTVGGFALMMIDFNPPAPCGAGHDRRRGGIPGGVNFNPPAPCGAGRQSGNWAWRRIGFQSTRPVRGGTATVAIHFSSKAFQSTRPVRGGTRLFPFLLANSGISIHPPRAGRDDTVE